ncbi:MAG: hypothetical protein ACXV3S_01625, partial [Kineosporiaceae bacterium]
MLRPPVSLNLQTTGNLRIAGCLEHPRAVFWCTAAGRLEHAYGFPEHAYGFPEHAYGFPEHEDGGPDHPCRRT